MPELYYLFTPIKVSHVTVKSRMPGCVALRADAAGDC